jgi:hypothetical protein
VSNSEFKFYLVILDDFSHFAWTFSLCQKCDVLPTLIAFHAFVYTQFQWSIMCLQIDNDKEFDNHVARSFFTVHGIVLRLISPYTSKKNGRIECTLYTLDDSMHTMLIHVVVPLSFWPDALTSATYLLNHHPCHVRQQITPYDFLLGHALDYDHLRVFRCLCYPSLAATSPHKLAPRSFACVFLGYPAKTKGYYCYNPDTRRVTPIGHARAISPHFSCPLSK